MAERLRFRDGAPSVFDSTSYSSSDFAGLSGQFANFAVFLRDLKPVSRRCADPSFNVSASRSNSFAVRNRASQMIGLPALSTNSRYQWASSRNLRGYSCRCMRGWSMASVVAIGAITSSPRQPIYPAWLAERARDRRGSRSRRCGHLHDRHALYVVRICAISPRLVSSWTLSLVPTSRRVQLDS
jgi:hypothetical protein